MRELFVPVVINGKDQMQKEYIYNIEELPVLDLMLRAKTSTTRQRESGGRFYKVHYLEIPCAFDIETTNMYQRRPDGGILPDPRPYAFMYQWQLAIDKYVIFGRTWDEWLRALNYISNNMNLSKEHRLVCYVHNLPFRIPVLPPICKNYGRILPGPI